MSEAASTSFSKDYAAVREGGAGLIDLSARGRVTVGGSEAARFLNWMHREVVKPWEKKKDPEWDDARLRQMNTGPAFNGTIGVGSGLRANRPTTCTPEVAYWATDEQRLYQ